MISINMYTRLANDILQDLPSELFNSLNGGVIIEEEAKLHPESLSSSPLYIMGEYHSEPHGLGKYIILYYGSFIEAYGNIGMHAAKNKLRKIIHHELTHHIETMAGDKSLIYSDRERLDEYRRGRF